MNKHIIMQGDLHPTVKFLQDLRPGGPWNLLAVVPDVVGAEAATFTDPVKALMWAEARHGGANIYYTRNPATRGTGRKGRVIKDDISKAEGSHVDIDQDEEGHIAGHPERKARVVAKLRAFETPPTFIIDSGGGIQALWQLLAPTEDIRLVERINMQLIAEFGGDAGTHDVGRPLRLPGTVNLPNASKRARGQSEAMATVVESTARSYDVWELPVAPLREREERRGDEGGELTPEQLAKLLAVVDTLRYRKYESWISLCAACHDATDGFGYGEWAEWCRRDPDYADVEDELLQAKWGSFKAGKPGGAGIGTVLKAVVDAGRPELVVEVMGRDADEFDDEFEPEATAGRNAGGLSYLRADEIVEKALSPLWPGRIFVGKLTTLAGIPDQGKSVVTCDITARVTNGAEWPDGSGTAPVGEVIILSAEDDPADTIRPRLRAAGARLEAVYVLNSLVTVKKGRRMFNIADDLAKLTLMVERHPAVNTLIIDPANAYMGTSKEHDSFRDSDVRAVLGPLKEWAEEHQIAVIIVTHFKKGGTGRAIDQVMGSLAFTALSRSAWAVIEEKDREGGLTGRKLLARIKQNISEPVDALAYKLVGVDIGNGISAPIVQWGESVKGGADEQVGNPKSRPAEKLMYAVAFLKGELAEGPVPAADIMTSAREAGFSEKTLNRAKEEVGAISAREEGRWVWRFKEAGDEF